MNRGNYSTSFGPWLKRRRKELGLTQPVLARRVACSVQTVDKIEAGVRRPSEQIAALLADCLDVAEEERSQFVEFARAELPAQGVAQPASADNSTPWRTFHRLRHPSNLPAQPNELVGRLAEMEAASALLRRSAVRLVTLHGPPGVGKTRLGLRVASDLMYDFSDGAFLVALAPIRDPGLVISAIARTLRVQEVAGRSSLESLRTYLRDKQMLIVLDNFEQVTAAAPFLAQLLEVAPRVKVLATSRVALHVYGEHDFEVPPLLDYDSVRLFVERAQAVKSDFSLTSENTSAVSEICRQLDGLPLAIELAASRIRLLTPQAMLARLGGGLGLLRGGEQDLPARHQTLRNAIAWSYDLLDEPEKVLFKRLGVFVGGCTLDAIEAACDSKTDDLLDGVESLISKSLVHQQEGVGGEPRFVMLETIHEYARGKLAESGEVEVLRRRHAEYFLALAEQAESQLAGNQQARWLARSEEEHDNLRAVLSWAGRSKEGESALGTPDGGETEDGELGLRLAGALWWFWYVHGHLSEGRKQLSTMLSLKGSKGDALGAPASGADVPAASARAKALLGAGWLAWTQADYDAANSLSKESLAICRELGNKEGMALALNSLGIAAQNQGDLVSASSLYEQSLAISRELGYSWGIASSVNNLGVVAKDQGDYDRAHVLHEESLAIRVQLGDKRGIAVSLSNLAELAKNQGDYERARSLYQKSLAIRVELGYKWGFAGCLLGLAKVSGLEGFAESAARLWGAAEALREAMGTPLAFAELTEYECDVAAARAQLDEEAWQAAWREGRAIRLEEAIAYALDQAHRGEGPCPYPNP